VEIALDGTLELRGLLGIPVLLSGNRESSIRMIADMFDVNPIVARIRLEALYPLSAEQQLTL
jgi:hypothetical protein